MQRYIAAILCLCFLVVTSGTVVSQAQVAAGSEFAIDDAWINPERRPMIQPIGLQLGAPTPLIEEMPQAMEIKWYVYVIVAVIVIVIVKHEVDNL